MKKFLFLCLPAVFLVTATAAPAKPFIIFGKPLTFRMEAAEAAVVLFGHLENTQKTKAGADLSDFGEYTETTDFVIHHVLKNHLILAGQKKSQIPRYWPNKDAKKPATMLLFADIYKGKLDFYRGVFCTPAVVDYLKGLLAIDAKDRAKQLRYCFDFLDHADKEIAQDAFAEFRQSSQAELSQLAKTLPPAQLRQWLMDEKNPPEALDLYGLLLGHCGTAKDASLLRMMFKKNPSCLLGLLDRTRAAPARRGMGLCLQNGQGSFPGLQNLLFQF